MAGAVQSVGDATDQHSFLTVCYLNLINIILKASVRDDLKKIKTNSKFENFPTNEINFVISKSMEN